MKIYLIGIGMGREDTLTLRAKEIIDSADLIIGAERMVAWLPEDKNVFVSYRAGQIAEVIAGNKNKKLIAVLLSGDTGFYSGAKRLISTLNKYDVEVLPGISSVAYLAARLKISWQDEALVSLHGTSQNVIGTIRQNRKTFVLLGSGNNVRELCEKLNYYNMGNVILHIAQRLSYEDEKLTVQRADKLKTFNFDNLSVMLVINPTPQPYTTGAIADEAFVRGSVPMTKEEVRTLSIAKLGLNKNSLLYDIGAGTGSVAVEAALKMTDGLVYAIERNEEALKLIEANKKKFAADNLTLVKGQAPEALEALTAPTHAFIGGSGGNMEAIISCLLAKNPGVKIVINAISLNTLTQVVNIVDSCGLKADFVSVSAAGDKMAGSHRLMLAQNPVYIITLTKGD